MNTGYQGFGHLTSFTKIVHSQAEMEQREKVYALQKEFAEIDYNHDRTLQKEELYSYLDRKAGKTFDRDIADEIFEEMVNDKKTNAKNNAKKSNATTNEEKMVKDEKGNAAAEGEMAKNEKGSAAAEGEMAKEEKGNANAKEKVSKVKRNPTKEMAKDKMGTKSKTTTNAMMAKDEKGNDAIKEEVKVKKMNPTINAFIKVYLEAEARLKSKIEIARANKESYKRQQEECLKKAEEEKLTENLNVYGIADNSVVYVAILEAQSIKPFQLGGPMNVSIEVSFDDEQKVKTASISNEKEQKLNWDEKVTFNVKKSESVIKFRVYETRLGKADILLGIVSVPLRELKDQNLHDKTLELLDANGAKGPGQLHVKLQWIHSKVKYFSTIAQKWLENYNKEEEELREYERYLETLYDPFPGLRAVQKFKNNDEIQQPPVELSEKEKKLIDLMNQAARTLVKEQDPSEGFWAKVTIIMCIVEIVMAIFLSFGRSTFFEVLCTIFILFYLKHGILADKLSLKIFSFVILVSVAAFDIIWLSIYSGNWTNIDSYDVVAEGGTRKFVVIFSYFNIIFKLIFALLCYTLHLQLVRYKGLLPEIATGAGSKQ